MTSAAWCLAVVAAICSSAPAGEVPRVERSFHLEQQRFLLGEPIVVEFRITVHGAGRWQERVGGNYLGRGRDDNFLFLLRHDSGQWAADPFAHIAAIAGGGVASIYEIHGGESQSHRLGLQRWAVIDRPGRYDLYCFRSEPGDASANLPLLTALDPALVAQAPRDFRWSTLRDMAHLQLTVDKGTPQQERAMVRQWTEIACADSPATWPATRVDAAREAICFARGEAFLPLLATWRGVPAVRFMTVQGLATNPHPLAAVLLLEAPAQLAAAQLAYLHPQHALRAAPHTIAWLMHADATVRHQAARRLWAWSPHALGEHVLQPPPAESDAAIYAPMQQHAWQWWNLVRVMTGMPAA